MAPRANWKGFLKIAEVACPVALYTAASTSERISLHTINRATGHRVHRQFVDSDTGKPVDRDDQVKGYQAGSGDYVMLEPEEIAAALPQNDKTLAVDTFIGWRDIDDLYFDRPYYLGPADRPAEGTFCLIRDGMRAQKVGALAQTVLFRRVRTLLIRPHGDGLLATTLHFDYEVRPAKGAFDDVRDIKIKGEMLELAEHIIKTKTGKFDPAKFDDRYEAALAELVKAKADGRKIEPRKPPAREKVVDLMQVLRESAGIAGKAKPAPKPATGRAKATKAKRAAPQRKAG